MKDTNNPLGAGPDAVKQQKETIAQINEEIARRYERALRAEGEPCGACGSAKPAYAPRQYLVDDDSVVEICTCPPTEYVRIPAVENIDLNTYTPDANSPTYKAYLHFWQDDAAKAYDRIFERFYEALKVMDKE